MIFTFLLAAAALHGVPRPVLVPQNTSEATAEGTEILRRILAESLDEAFEEKDKHDQVTVRRKGVHVNSLVTTLWAGDRTVQHSRGFHVPDAGLFFALDASLPTITKEKAAEPEESDQPTDDEWERIRREVRGRVNLEGNVRRLYFAQPREAQLDPAAIEKVVATVLKTLARHATRIEGLGTRETVTVALRLSGKGHNLLQDFSGHGEFRLFEPQPGQPGFESEIEPGEYEVGAEDGDEDDTRQVYTYALSTSFEDAREQNLVIRVAVGDLAGYAEGTAGASLEGLRKRALINRY